jgi:hypothetical protein
MIEMNAIRPAFEKLRIKISSSFLKHLIRALEAFNRREASPPTVGIYHTRTFRSLSSIK